MKTEFIKNYSMEFSHVVDSGSYWVTATVEVSGHISFLKESRWFWGSECGDVWTEVECENSKVLSITIQNEMIDDEFLSLVNSCPHVLAQCEHEAKSRGMDMANKDEELYE